jgi:hypothetical protein
MEANVNTQVLELLQSLVGRIDKLEAKPSRAPKTAPVPAQGSVTTDGRAYRIVDGPTPAGCQKWLDMLKADGVKANVARVERGYLVEIGTTTTITETVAEAKLLLRGAVMLSLHLTPIAK